MGGLPQKLALEPAHVPFGKPSGFRGRAALRDGHPRRAVGSKPQHIAARPLVTDESDTHLPARNADKSFTVRSALPGAKRPFKLHAAS